MTSKILYPLIPALRSTVKYNRKEKLYCVHNSQGEEVPLNSPNKLEALFKLLRYDCAYVADVIDILIATRPIYFNKFANKQRLIKAGFILRDALLRDVPKSSNYLCISQSGTGEIYEVNSDRLGNYRCTCTDFEYGRNADSYSDEIAWNEESTEELVNDGGNVCKHILAVFLAVLINNKL